MEAPLIAAGGRALMGAGRGSQIVSGSAKRTTYQQRYTDQKWQRRRKQMMTARKLTQDREALQNDTKRRRRTARNPALTMPNPTQDLRSNALNMIGDVALKVKAISTTVRIGVGMVGMYFTFQLPLYFFGLLFFVGSVINIIPTTPFGITVEILDVFFDFMPDVSIFSALSLSFNGINTGLCWVFMASAAIAYSIAEVHWWGGKKSGAKSFWFCFAIVMYGATFFQFLPWALPWMYVVARNPE